MQFDIRRYVLFNNIQTLYLIFIVGNTAERIKSCIIAILTGFEDCLQSRPINLSLSQFLKDGCIGERQMALVCKKHKRPEGQQVAHILTLNLY